MIIGNIGWSGNANWGDERMAYCLKHYFHKDTIVRFNGWLDAINHIKKLNRCDYILIGGGGLIFRGFNAYLPFLQKINKPFGCIGISIEADQLHKDMTQGLEYLKEHAEFIYVRDKKSKLLLENHYKTILGPDISFLYPYVPSKKSGTLIGLNLRNWPWWDSELFGEADTLFRKIDKKMPWFKNVYPFKKWNARDLVSRIKSEKKHISPIPFYFGSYDTTDYQYLKSFFPRVPNKYSQELMKQCRFIIGMRLHSIIFATQLGIPFISLSYEPKNANYCSDLGLPELSLQLKEYTHISNSMKYVENNYETIQKQLREYTQQAQKDVSRIFKSIQKLMYSH